MPLVTNTYTLSPELNEEDIKATVKKLSNPECTDTAEILKELACLIESRGN